MALVVKSCTVCVPISWIRSLITSRGCIGREASGERRSPGYASGTSFLFGLHFVVSVPNSFVAYFYTDIQLLGQM